MGGHESVQTFFSNLHCLILMEIDNLRYLITVFYGSNSSRKLFSVTHTHTHPHERQLTQQCFELEQIRDHIYSRKIAHFYCKSGLRFALAQSIAELIAPQFMWVWVCVTLNNFREELLP